MVQPIDYMSQLQAPNLGAQLLGGIQAGAAVRAVRDERAAAEQARAQQEQFQADLQNALANPNARNFAAMTAKYPQMREAFKQSWDLLNEDQRNAEFGAGIQVYSALQNGNPKAALSVLDEQISAMQNSGQDVSDLQNVRRQIETDPRGAQGYVGLVLSNTDPDRWGKIASEQREAQAAPYELSEKASKAQKAAVDAKFAESMATQDLAKKGWEIQKLANDINISRQNSQIAAINANLKREENDVKRQELQLKLDEKVAKRDTDLREKVANVETGRASIDNMLNSADRILKTPAGVINSAAGPISSRLPTVSSDTADLEALVETLSSQAFMAQIPNLKGMGALSNAEGEKLQASLQNLSLKQSPERLIENVREAQRLMLKARSNLADRYGVPDTIPDRPALESQPASSGFRVLGVE